MTNNSSDATPWAAADLVDPARTAEERAIDRATDDDEARTTKERPWGPTATRRKLEAPLEKVAYDPDSGMTRAEQTRFHAWIRQRRRILERNDLPVKSWMDTPYPYGKGSLPQCGS